MDLDQAVFLPLGVLEVHDLLHGVADGAHGHHDGLGLGVAVVVEELIVGAQLGVDLAHVLLHHAGESLIVLVPGLVALEEDVRVLGGAAEDRVVGVQGSGPEGVHGVHVHHFLQVLVVPHLHLADLVGGAEAVEEVEEGHPAADGRQMGHGAKVHDLLGIVGAQHGVARGPAGHDVGVVPEDGQGVGGQSPGGDVGDPGEQTAGDLIHIGDHQQQTLGGGEGGGQGPGGEGAVDRAGGAALRLHHRDLDGLAEHILPALRRPLVRQLRHDRGRGDGVNGRDFGEGIGHMGRCGVAVHRLLLSCHDVSS